MNGYLYTCHGSDHVKSYLLSIWLKNRWAATAGLESEVALRCIALVGWRMNYLNYWLLFAATHLSRTSIIESRQTRLYRAYPENGDSLTVWLQGNLHQTP
jgi:hypothetical protein